MFDVAKAWKLASSAAKKVGSKMGKLVARKQADNGDLSSDSAKDPTVYIAQLAGASIIFAFLFIYKFIRYYLSNEEQKEQEELAQKQYQACLDSQSELDKARSFSSRNHIRLFRALAGDSYQTPIKIKYPRRRKQGIDLDEIENYANYGMITGVGLAAAAGKIFDKILPGTSYVWTPIVGFLCGIVGAILFVLVPSLAEAQYAKEKSSEKKNQNYFAKLKLGVKVGTTLLSGFVALACFLVLNPVATATKAVKATAALWGSIWTTIAYFVGAVLGVKYFPKIANRYQQKDGNSFTDGIDTGYVMGSILGGTIGAFIGACIIPGLGITIGGLIGAAIGTAAIAVLAVLVPSIREDLSDPNIEFACKLGGVVGGAIGAVAGAVFLPFLPFLPFGILNGSLAGAALGTAVAFFVVKTISYIKSIVTDISDSLNNSAQKAQAQAQSQLQPQPQPELQSQKNNSKNQVKAEKENGMASELNLALSAGILFGGLIGGIFAGPLGYALGSLCGGLFGLAVVGVYKLRNHLANKEAARALVQTVEVAPPITQSNSAVLLAQPKHNDINQQVMSVKPPAVNSGTHVWRRLKDPAQPLAAVARSHFEPIKPTVPVRNKKEDPRPRKRFVSLSSNKFWEMNVNPKSPPIERPPIHIRIMGKA